MSKHTKLAVIIYRRGLLKSEALELINKNTDKPIQPYLFSKMINGKAENMTLKTLKILKEAFSLDRYDELIDENE